MLENMKGVGFGVWSLRIARKYMSLLYNYRPGVRGLGLRVWGFGFCKGLRAVDE